MRTTGEIIREYRKKNNLTTNDFAKTLGVSGVFISYIENDKKKIPEAKLDILQNLLDRDDFIDLLKWEKRMSTPEYLVKKLSEYNAALEFELPDISEFSENGKNKIKEYIELVKIAERKDNFKDSIDISKLNEENKIKAREYINLLEFSQNKN